uniref:Uncharacterized protein n=1 Tax=Ditylenchus dipsaci TaxID=166011 RepID=A0A915CZZ8_9BILA
MKYRLNKLYQQDNQHKVVVARSIAMLETEYNDWTIWKCLFDSAFKLLETEQAEDNKSLMTLYLSIFQQYPNNFCRMIERLSEICLRATQSTGQNGQQSQRGPLLARLELIDRLLKYKPLEKTELQNHKLGLPLDSLKQLASCSYTKTYCFADLKCYLHLLSGQEIQLLVEYVQEIYGDKYSAGSANETAALCSGGFSVQQLFGKLPADASKGQEASAYAQLIANYTWFCHQQHFPTLSNQLLKSIILLEYVLAKYTNCDATVPLLLCRFYSLLGGSKRVAELVKHLDIKYIQRDSMGYLQCLLDDKYGKFKSAILRYTSLGVLYDQSEREVSECIVNAYKNGHFSQIPKLCEFVRKCSHSMYCAATDVMNRSLSSCFAIDSLDVIAEMLLGENDGQIEWEKVSDNRDFGMLASLTAIHSEADLKDVREDSFNELISSLKLEHYLCRAIGVFSHKQVTKEKFTSVLQEFTSHLEYCQKTYEEPIKTANRLEYFSNTKIRDLLNNGYFKLPLLVLNIGQILLNKKLEYENGSGNQQNGGSLHLITNALPELEKLKTILKSFMPQLPDSIQGLQIPGYLAKCAKSLHYIVLSLLGFKLIENMSVSFGWVKCSTKTRRRKPRVWYLNNFLRDLGYGDLQSGLEEYRAREHLSSAEKTMENSLKCSYSESITEMLNSISRTKNKWLDSPE